MPLHLGRRAVKHSHMQREYLFSFCNTLQITSRYTFADFEYAAAGCSTAVAICRFARRISNYCHLSPPRRCSYHATEEAGHHHHDWCCSCKLRVFDSQPLMHFYNLVVSVCCCIRRFQQFCCPNALISTVQLAQDAPYVHAVIGRHRMCQMMWKNPHWLHDWRYKANLKQ